MRCGKRKKGGAAVNQRLVENSHPRMGSEHQKQGRQETDDSCSGRPSSSSCRYSRCGTRVTDLGRRRRPCDGATFAVGTVEVGHCHAKFAGLPTVTEQPLSHVCLGSGFLRTGRNPAPQARVVSRHHGESRAGKRADRPYESWAELLRGADHRSSAAPGVQVLPAAPTPVVGRNVLVSALRVVLWTRDAPRVPWRRIGLSREKCQKNDLSR